MSKMIPLAVPNLTGNEKNYLNECIDSTYVSSVGKFVTQIEAMTAEKSGAKFGVATSSGTTGLHLALIGCGVKEGDLVIIPTFTFIATANAVSHCGAVPWVMDISPDSWCLNGMQLKEELEKKTIIVNKQVIHKVSGRRVGAIMPVYTLGNIPDMDLIGDIAREYQIPLIADAAAALGAVYKGQPAGCQADITVFSFNGNKTVTAGGGGMVVGDNEELMGLLKHLSTTARVTAEYDHDLVGYNYRMTNLQAAVGCAQLERLEEFVAKKRYIRKVYRESLSDIPYIETFPEPQMQKSACWFSGIVLMKEIKTETHIICEMLADRGIEARSFWKPIHLQKPYQNIVCADSLEISSDIWRRIVTLPCSTAITEEELVKVCSSVHEVLK